MEQHDYIVLLEKFFKKEASSEERRILIEWIRKPGIRDEFNSLCEQMWKEAAVEIDKTVEEEMWNHLQRNLDEPKILYPKKRRWQPIIYKVAATILLPVCLGLATYFGVGHINKVSQDPFMVAVDYGQKANLTLPDGTKVWLNSATHLSYDAEYNKSDRKIYLDGEAYFDVARNEKCPFIVHTHAMDIEVLGTKFNVEAYAKQQNFEASLIQGKIKIKSPSDNNISQVLLPDYKSTLKNGKLVISKIEDYNIYRWKEGLYCFKNKSFIEIIKDLEKYYNLKIIVDKPSITNIILTGKFRISDGLDYALRILQKDVPFIYNKHTTDDIIYIK